MSLIDVRCEHDHISEVYRAIADYPATPACPTCAAATVQIHLPQAARAPIDPVVVYRAPDGSFRFPGDANGRSAQQYSKQGFERVELRSAAEVRRFEGAMNKHEYARASRRVERMQQLSEAREHHTRRELRHVMQSMTRFGRDVARAAMARNDNKPKLRAKDAGFHVDAFSNDRSNRDESRSPDGRRRRD